MAASKLTASSESGLRLVLDTEHLLIPETRVGHLYVVRFHRIGEDTINRVSHSLSTLLTGCPEWLDWTAAHLADMCESIVLEHNAGCILQVSTEGSVVTLGKPDGFQPGWFQ